MRANCTDNRCEFIVSKDKPITRAVVYWFVQFWEDAYNGVLLEVKRTKLEGQARKRGFQDRLCGIGKLEGKLRMIKALRKLSYEDYKKLHFNY